MDIVIFSDNTIGVSLHHLAKVLTAEAADVRVKAATNRFRLSGERFRYEEEHAALAALASREGEADAYIFITNVPYENNFFYEGKGNIFLVSVSGWHNLTDIPVNNGICYFIVAITLKHIMFVGHNHDENTGCINDYMWDKSIVGAGMRAAFLCESCRSSTVKETLDTTAFVHCMTILDMVSAQSRRGSDVLYGPSLGLSEAEGKKFDVFLCHNSQDKPSVRELNKRLKTAGIRTWFDADDLIPGDVWQEVLQDRIKSCSACAVIVGPNGEGPWQQIERRDIISQFVNRGCRVIPVLIEGSSEVPTLPPFLGQFMWSDLRDDDGKQFERLVKSIASSRV